MVGLEPPEDGKDSHEYQRDPLVDTMKFYVDAYHQQLFESDAAIQFLSGREISIEAIEEFKIGFADGNIDEYTETVSGLEAVIEAGLVGVHNGRAYEFFRGRVVFPVYDIIGRPIGLVGRLVSNDLRPGDRKYLNTRETRLYDKKMALYGVYQAKKHIRTAGYAILVEGQVDVVGLWCVGVKNVIGGSGTALTPEQVALISRITSDVVLMYDGDLAGRKALVRAIDTLVAGGFSPEVILLDNGKDPDDMRMFHGDKTPGWIQANRIGYMDYYLSLWAKADKPPLKDKVIDKICDTIAKIPNEISQTNNVAWLCEKTRIPDRAIWTKVFADRKAPPAPAQNTPQGGGLEFMPEYQILCYLVNFPEHRDDIVSMLNIQDDVPFRDPRLQEIREYVLGSGVSHQQITSGETGKVFASIAASHIEYDEDSVFACCNAFRLVIVRRLIDEANEEIAKPSATREYKELIAKKRIFLINEKIKMEANE